MPARLPPGGPSAQVVLLVFYAGYVIACAVWGKVLDALCPTYGKATTIGFASQ